MEFEARVIRAGSQRMINVPKKHWKDFTPGDMVRVVKTASLKYVPVTKKTKPSASPKETYLTS